MHCAPCGTPVGVWLLIDERRCDFLWFPPFIPAGSVN